MTNAAVKARLRIRERCVHRPIELAWHNDRLHLDHMGDLLTRLQEALGDRYRIEREIGHGGTGVVFVAADLKHGRTVAIKVLRPEVSRSLGADRFLREIRIAAGLSHPNIVSLIDSGEAAGHLYYVMFHVEGESLRDRLSREKQLPLDEALHITREVADALSYAHGRGVIHRDIKPENILFEAGHAVVADFGIAKAIHEAGADRLTETGLAVGTPVYMSPEQATGVAAVDARTDLYSLACVLYEMLAGTPPWVGATPQVILARKTLEPVPGLRVARDTVPPAVEAAITRALARTPADRQATIDEFVDALSAERAPGRPLWQRLRQPVILGAAVLVTVVVIGTVGRFTSRDGTETRPIDATFAQVTTESGVEDGPSLSPDGEWVVYAGDGDGGRDIFLRTIGGQRVINLTGDSPADDSQPAFSPDGSRITFRSSREGGGIFVMGRTGEGVRRVTNEGFNPAWSPDGLRLVYGMESAGLTPLNGELRSELWVVPVEGGDPRRVSASDRDALDPSWSPNGFRIAYTARGTTGGDTAGMDIQTIPAAGGESVRVTEDRASDWSPAWSGDGQHLYFVSNRGGSMNLWRVPIDEESGRRLGPPELMGAPAQFVAHPSVSADGRLIAFSNVVTTSQNIQKAAFDPVTGALSDFTWLTRGTRRWANADPTSDGEWVVLYSQDRPEGDLYVVRGDGTGLRQLTADSVIDRVPRWSPDGSRILYFSNRSGRLEIWAIRPDGSDNRQVTGEGAAVGAWSPDGTRIAATTQRTVEIIDPSRRWEEQSVERLPAPDTALGRFTANDWSPDGRFLAGGINYQDTGIITYSFDTRTYEKLTDFGQWPVWLPDSRRILFVSGGNSFHMLDTRTREVTRVHSSEWDIIGPPRLTRDARQIFFSRRVTDGDIWVVRLRE